MQVVQMVSGEHLPGTVHTRRRRGVWRGKKYRSWDGKRGGGASVKKKLTEKKEKYRIKDGRLGAPGKTFLGQTNKVRQLRRPRRYYYYYYCFSPPPSRFSDLKTLWFSVYPLRVIAPTRRKRNHCRRLPIFPPPLFVPIRLPRTPSSSRIESILPV